MSMSTPGPERVPSTVKVGKTSGQGKPPAGAAKSSATKPGAAKAGAAKAGAAKGGGGKNKGRKPITPVTVAGSRNWGPIILGSVVGLVVLLIVGYAIFAVARGSRSWEDRAADINGVVNYRAKKNPQI